MLDTNEQTATAHEIISSPTRSRLRLHTHDLDDHDRQQPPPPPLLLHQDGADHLRMTAHPPQLSSSPASSVHSLHRPNDKAFLRPEDAISIASPPRRPQTRKSSPLGPNDTVTIANPAQPDSRMRREKRRGASSSRRKKTAWKKLLWVKQSYPDNYTDEDTFLDHLQRNPRLRPYEFWPLVADSTIIVQHVCSVIIFVCCFTAIFQERVSPQTVVGWATVGTVAGWIIRDYWQTQEEAEAAAAMKQRQEQDSPVDTDADKESPTNSASGAEFGMPFREQSVPLTAASADASRVHSRAPSLASVGATSFPQPLGLWEQDESPTVGSPAFPPLYGREPSVLSPRMQERLTTVKSAVLIYFSLLGLSPILKSLTMSTSSDSIWALSSWLMCINVFTFDYGAGPEAKFPASLPTNAALMASTVLASRLPSTTHVFSLTLFSIEVFGLFPVFRRHLRHHSWTGHLWLTTCLVVVSSGGLSMTISGGGWGMGVLGVILGGLITCLSMGFTSWWLIGRMSRFP